MDQRRLSALLGNFKSKRFLVLGDVMLDRFIFGNVSRISPEAPVPVVHVEHETAYPGGAANVARNLLPFCDRPLVAGAYGPGTDGERLLHYFQQSGLDTSSLLEEEGRKTIVKIRVVARGQQVVRVDRETRQPLSPDLVRRTLELTEKLLPHLDGIIFEDYAKGMLTDELVRGVIEMARPRNLCLTVDPNPNNPIDWRGVTAVKPNRSEAFLAAGIPDQPLRGPLAESPVLRELAARLRKKWDCPYVIITLGELGMVLGREDGSLYHCPPQAREVFDVSGAGDTGIALFSLSLCSGATPEEAVELANRASSIVVGKIGTATVTPDELLRSFDHDQD